MPSQAQMKAAMQAYIDQFNAGSLDGIIGLYADTATVEDPVGKTRVEGIQAIRAFYAKSLAAGAKLKLAAPIRGSFGNSAAMAFEVELNMPGGRSLIRVIDVMTFDDAGKFSSMRAYWGPEDMTRIST
ncbi:MAG: nuclear transport factor 2 family protein [Proteobacteria bacterium]|nr:nuclear transport factor 2 family protein [Pseudomonadota bacterium]HQR02527.1 nuclear transport factor 2 family protein [Rhodocyclaceae bacterium]